MRKKKSSGARIPVARPENYFVLVNGIPLKNLKELAVSMESMNDWVFGHHVNESRNDFAAWISDVFKEHELAKDVGQAKDPGQIESLLLRHMVKRYI
jgi:hypothetical protein